MAPEDRRDAIIQATIPLLRTRGWTVTTKEISAASGVSDGTIFSVFNDKEELLLAALETALDPRPIADQLSLIDPSLPLEERLTQAIDVLLQMVTQVWQLASTLRLEEVQGRLPRHYSSDEFCRKFVAKVFEPSRAELQVDPALAARILLALMSGVNPMFFDKPLSTSEIITVMLHGIKADPKAPSVRTKATVTRGKSRRRSDVA